VVGNYRGFPRWLGGHHGVNVTVVHLPEVGIHENKHIPFSDLMFTSQKPAAPPPWRELDEWIFKKVQEVEDAW
jgi:hypothetical protein